MANIWQNLKLKSNKSNYEISKELNIPEEKVREIVKGEREVPTKEIDRVHNAFATRNLNKPNDMEYALMKKFFIDNDIMDLKNKFNYPNAKELAEDIGIGVATFFRLRPHKIDLVRRDVVIKAYDFFQNEFNKRANKPESKKKRYYSKNHNIIIKKENLDSEVIDWFNKTDIKTLRYQKRLTGKEMCVELGFKPEYVSTYCKFENKKAGSSNWAIVQQMYNYWHGLELIQISSDTKKDTQVVPNNEVTVEGSLQVFNEVAESVEPMDLPVWEETTNDETVEEAIKEEVVPTIETSTYIALHEHMRIVKELQEKIERYEFLIDIARKNGNKD